MRTEVDGTHNYHGISPIAICRYVLTSHAFKPSLAKTMITGNVYFNAFKMYIVLESWNVKDQHKVGAAESKPLIQVNTKKRKRITSADLFER